MEPYDPSLSRRLASARKFFGTLLTFLKPRSQEVRAQRMCPFCGLITPRNKRLCQECGKSLNSAPLETKEAKQE
jgi:predicted amidophosphoribosyltransferase